MQFTKTHKIIIIACFTIILIGGYFFISKKNKPITENNQPKSATSTPGAIHVNTSTGGYTIEQVPLGEGQGVPQPIPDLNRSSKGYGSNTVNVEAITKALPQILDLQTMLKKNPEKWEAWIDLGINQKMAGDYQGAVISWQYASKLAPSDYISLGNLGNIYAYFIHDNAKAEMYYKQAITKGPTQEYLYTQFAEIYRDIFHSNTKALEIVNQGLKKMPNNANLLQLKASLTS